ncbi:MAG TPA: PEP-CTERM-box response regulator transcription factor [Steroidobacteraceae bacterium]|jgi:two-component system NtrC family response regulator|nr:PEP-CTERM-box response regulator transcription factor [Steroidobacteraceae bacterium]
MKAKRARLLIIEDDAGLQRQLKWAFDDFEVDCVATREEALNSVRRCGPSIVLQDLGLPPDPNGVEEGFATIEEIQRLAPDSKIIVITGREGREHAVRAIGLGAFDYCQKPVDTNVLSMIVDRALRIQQLESENDSLSETRSPALLRGVIAASDSMQKVWRMIRRLAETQITVLLLGESGTGKELIAQALHELSPRAAKPLVAINCAAIPENLLESELFGHERGAFTGAVKQTIGKVERAAGGTLFLDEIGDMPLPLQSKLLRFLQERVIERVGGRELIRVDVRIVAATNRDLRLAIEQKTFREDLYYRINEVAVTIPPLRERGSDSVLIANHLLQQACERHGRPRLRLSPEAAQAIEAYSWPGNVRELANRVNAAAVMADDRIVTPEDLSLQPAVATAAEFPPLRQVRQRAEMQAVRRALALSDGNLTRAAELLGITRPTLYDMLQRIAPSDTSR